jgi:hypothetical protein
MKRRAKAGPLGALKGECRCPLCQGEWATNEPTEPDHLDRTDPDNPDILEISRFILKHLND